MSPPRLPLSHRTARVLLSIALITGFTGGGYAAHRHGLSARWVEFVRDFTGGVERLWEQA